MIEVYYMEQYLIIWVLILVVGTVVCYVIAKNVIKALATFLFIIFLFLAITATLIYADWQHLKTQFTEKEAVIILQENQEYIFAVIKKDMLDVGDIGADEKEIPSPIISKTAASRGKV